MYECTWVLSYQMYADATDLDSHCNMQLVFTNKQKNCGAFEAHAHVIFSCHLLLIIRFPIIKYIVYIIHITKFFNYV